MTESNATESRLLSFRTAGGLFALPISDILEVSVATPLASIPTLDRSRGGVMSHRGAALPVVSLGVLLGSAASFEDSAAARADLDGKHLLVLSRGDDHSPQLGLPVDSIEGLVSAPSDSEKCGGIVKERFCLAGREVVVIDPRQLMTRATSVIEGGSTGVHPATGG